MLFTTCLTVYICIFTHASESRILDGTSKGENFILREDNDEPLYLTKYIDNGDLETARRLSRCGLLPNAAKVESYSGLITVNKEYNSNIFFWFFPAMNSDRSAPVLLWLQGGPGISGLFGLFIEHGPYIIRANLTASLREFHWARTFNLIYVDNPVGTGFSFTDDDQGYVTNQTEMANDMYEFLQQFFKLFNIYKDNDFYIAGESYAGKYVPSLAHKINSMGTSANFKLVGISIGNGMCDPETMMDYSEYLYNIGLIDENQAKAMKNLSDLIVQNIKNNNFYDALVEMDKLIIQFDTFPYISLYKNFTGMNFYYNFLSSETPKDFSYYLDYIKLSQFKKALHLGDLPYQDGKTAQRHLLLDIMKSAKLNVSVIMDNYRVLIYNGQLDVIIPYPLTVNFLKSIKWKFTDDYKRAVRNIWYLRNSTEIAGYVHNVKDFYEIMVRNAGHILPYDKPEVAFDLISRFLNKESYV